MLDWLKEGKVGDWSIESFEVSESDASMYNLSQMFEGYSRPVRAGKYTRLNHAKRGIVMSDTPAELSDLMMYKISLAEMARNKPECYVHISGLGLGITAYWALELGCNVEVVELDPDLIELVGSQLKSKFNGKLNIIQADALEWKPPKGQQYHIVWHDIWDDLNTENLIEHTLLIRRFSRRVDWQGAWVHDWLIRQRREERRQEKEMEWFR